MKYFEKFNPKKYHFLDFQAKIMLGVVNKNCLQLNNSQLLSCSWRVWVLYTCTVVNVYIFPQYRQVFFASLSKTPGGSGQVESCVRVPGCGVRMSIDCVYIIWLGDRLYKCPAFWIRRGDSTKKFPQELLSSSGSALTTYFNNFQVFSIFSIKTKSK
mgnify:CR=1 FL=1